jgi:ribosomal protein S18 acetylase RimI-like enzyme
VITRRRTSSLGFGRAATIGTVGVHPDYHNRGIATRLLGLACARTATAGADTIEAWTRDDEPARWYRARGFAEDSHYLHVYADRYTGPDEPSRAVQSLLGLQPIKVFLHAPLDQEAQLRRQVRRVHICRFTRPIR